MAGGRPTVAFDVIGTLFGLERVRSRLVEADAPAESLELWLAQSLRDYFAISHSGEYAPLKQVLDEALPRALAVYGVKLPDEQRAEISGAFSELDPAPGGREAVERFANEGWRILTLTNGSEDSTKRLLERSGLTEHFDAVLSCDSIRTGKPHPDVYAMARKHADDVLWLVAAHGWDVAGAKSAGLRAAWVSTIEGRYLDVFPEPDVTAAGLAEAAEQILAR